MARLTADQATRLEQELIAMFQNNPSERYQHALSQIVARHPDLDGVVSMNDLNYRIPKLRRAGQIPPSKRVIARRSGSTAESSPSHPVARAYQELDGAKDDLEQAQRRYDQAQQNLRSVLRESLPQDFLDTLVHERESSGNTT